MAPDPRPSPTTRGAGDVGIVVPLRSFTLGKARLMGALDRDERTALARRMAERVLDAAGPLPVVVVSSAREVRAWASARGAAAIDDPGSLDAAAAAGRAWVGHQGFARVVVVHGDLPFATTFTGVADGGGDALATIVPCHRGDGTPVLALPSATPFRFSYGPGSFTRHRAEALRCGLAVRVVRDPDLAFDVDVPEDLAAMALRAGDAR